MDRIRSFRFQSGGGIVRRVGFAGFGGGRLGGLGGWRLRILWSGGRW